MTTLYTKTTALKLLPFAKSVLSVRECRNCIQVTYLTKNGGKCSTFLSKKAFWAFETQSRKERARAIEVKEVHAGASGKEYVVSSSLQDQYYVVRPGHPDAQRRCECGDSHFRGIRCKHQEAVAKVELAAAFVETAPDFFNEEIQLPKAQPIARYHHGERTQVLAYGSSYGGVRQLWVVDTWRKTVIAVVSSKTANQYTEAFNKKQQYDAWLELANASAA